jgi:secreted trypsin-like serine protease
LIAPDYPIPGTMVGAYEPRQDDAFVVQIQHDGVFCVGSLLAAQWVVSAAHCKPIYNVGETLVVAGTSTPGHGGQAVGVDGVVLHPMYSLNGEALYGDDSPEVGHDIALLHLDRPLPYPTVALGEDVSPGAQLRAAAFQMDCDGISVERRCHDPRRQDLDLSVVAPSRCAGMATAVEHCLQADRGKGLCRGSSGAPLLQQAPTGVRLVAIVSRDGDEDKGCAGGLAVVTSIAPHSAWISKTIAAGLGPDGLPAIAGPRR